MRPSARSASASAVMSISYQRAVESLTVNVATADPLTAGRVFHVTPFSVHDVLAALYTAVWMFEAVASLSRSDEEVDR